MIKNWVRATKARLMDKWAAEFGLLVVEIRVVGGTEYIVASDGSMRCLARGGKRSRR